MKDYLKILHEFESIDPMWIINIESGNKFRFEEINASFTAVTGLKPEQVEGRLIEEVLPVTSHKIVREKYTQVIKTGKIVDYIEIAVHPAGEKVGEIRVLPIKNDEGKVVKLMGIAHDITEKTILQRKLDEERDKISKRISAATIRSQERERNSISLELHDNVNQVLTTVKLYTELCISRSVDIDVYLRKCTGLLMETIDEIRRLSKQLASPAINSMGLSASFSELIESINQTRQADIRLITDLQDTIRLNEDMQMALYRIAQEQLTNILKHAQAKTVIVNLHNNPEEIFLHIKDDGIGFDAKRKTSGIGIANMTYRASLFNGKFELKSAKGKGCELKVSFPLK